MIRLLTEIEDETVSMETLANVYGNAETILDTLCGEEEALEYLEDVQEQCMQLGCWMHYIDPVGFRAYGKKMHNDPFYNAVDAAGELNYAYPDYNHEGNLAALRQACLHYMNLWHGNILSRDIGRTQANKDMNSADLTGYRLLGDSVVPLRDPADKYPAYNAAWLSPDGMYLMMTISRMEGGRYNTYIYPYQVGEVPDTGSRAGFTKC